MGRKIQNKVSLSRDERTKLETMSRDNSLSARSATRVLILPALDDSQSQRLNYRQIATALHVSQTTVSQTAKDYAMNGPEDALAYHFNPASLRKRKVTGEPEACVIRPACGKAPEGYADRTLELPAREANKKGVAEPVCKETIRLMLKKTNSSHG